MFSFHIYLQVRCIIAVRYFTRLGKLNLWFYRIFFWMEGCWSITGKIVFTIKNRINIVYWVVTINFERMKYWTKFSNITVMWFEEVFVKGIFSTVVFLFKFTENKRQNQKHQNWVTGQTELFDKFILWELRLNWKCFEVHPCSTIDSIIIVAWIHFFSHILPKLDKTQN